ncbi:MAG: GapR family DNA-binding domain-containing protein [Pseudomonadota bacterium]|nr:GapR family DNA-binding domain-containing protein [Pseudomonadota bacterium]
MSDDRLRNLVRAIQAYNIEIGDAIDGRRGVYEQAKAMGYDTKTIRNLVRRMRMNGADRDAADELLAQYEADMGIAGSAPAHADAGPPAKREKFVAPKGASSEQQLRAIISRVLELRCDRGEVNDTIKLELKKAKAAGFDPRKIQEACLWLEKCDRHGRDMMLASEELFQIYRDIGDGPQPAPKVDGDSKLVAMFAGPSSAEGEKKPASQKLRQVNDALAAAQISRMMRGN